MSCQRAHVGQETQRRFRLPDPDGPDDGDQGGGRTKGTKRAKYAARACFVGRTNANEKDLDTQGQRVSVVTSIDSELRPLNNLTTSVESRMDEIFERLGALEQSQAHLLGSAKAIEHCSPAATFVNPIRQDDDEANQFVGRESTHHDLSLSSQVAAMGALLSRPPSPKPGSGKQSTKVATIVELPDPPLLNRLLGVYFRDFDGYFPFLDRQDTESRIHNVIRRLGYSAHNRILVVTVDDLPIVALACIMLALAECVDPGEGMYDGDTTPGWERYLQCQQAIQRLPYSITLDLNVVRTQALTAAYLMHCEALSAASHAIIVAWRLAASIGLNNQKAWPNMDCKEVLQRQKLWWTIYYLDSQISRKSGIAYYIRDLEFDIDDFSLSSDVTDSTTTQTVGSTSLTRQYMQGLINLARLWGNVWDTFFAIGAQRSGEGLEIDIMDARILNIRRQLPKILAWETEQLEHYKLVGEDEPHARRRLQLYTRHELIRMLIRQNPVRQTTFAPDIGHTCSRLSRGIIHAHSLYTMQYPEARASGYFTTSSIVECIYHLAPVLRYSTNSEERDACVAALNQAHGILVTLSTYNSVARKALKALNGVVNRWSSVTNTGTPVDSGHRSGLATHNAPYTSGQVYSAIQTMNHLSPGDCDVDPGQWMDSSMGSLFGGDFDFRFEA
ncbi:hypothetical protein LTR86_009311 [Recurvomyces mirabilis]|nr:hypothetical protein LTR86_009311 [Recurvomyces mirabilis]